MFKFSKKSEANLAGVHPDLARVVRRALAISPCDFGVVCGARSLEAQKAAVARGTSRTMKSKHLLQADGYAHAVDLLPYVAGRHIVDWGRPWPGAPWAEVSGAMKKAAAELGVKIVWGGDWKSFRDGPHYELG